MLEVAALWVKEDREVLVELVVEEQVEILQEQQEQLIPVVVEDQVIRQLVVELV